jgi:hypothetical protein
VVHDPGNVQLPIRASLERAAPVGAGLVAGVAGFVVAPDHADGGFFSTSAQVVPVLLLALALEARLFGSPRRVLASVASRRLENTRRWLELATLAVLIVAEAQSLWVIRHTHGGGDPAWTVVGLAWGFVAIAAIAVFGTGKPRVTADIVKFSEAEDEIVVQIGLSNEFGDRAVRPLVQFLFGPGAEVAGKNPATGATFDANLWLTAPVDVPDHHTVQCRYAARRIELTPGDVQLTYFSLTMQAERVLVLVRADSAELDGGRVEAAAFVRRGDPLELIAARTR